MNEKLCSGNECKFFKRLPFFTIMIAGKHKQSFRDLVFHQERVNKV